MRITVIGAGATGLAVAAHLTTLGHTLHLVELEGEERNLAGLQASRTIRFDTRLAGKVESREIRIDAVSCDIPRALGTAQAVIVATVAQRHEQIAAACSPHLRRDQVLLITPGNLGSLIFRRICSQNAPLLGEVESNLHVVRRTGPAGVEQLLPVRPRHVSAFPAVNTQALIDALADCYQLSAARNIFETTLNHPNLDSHLPGMLLNAGLIEREDLDFHFYRDGLGAAALSVMEAQYREKVEVMRALGLEVRTGIELLGRIANKDDERFESFRCLPGPRSMTHRFLREEAFAGTSFLVSLAARTGIDVPVTRALLQLASTVDGRDYFTEGRTLDNLGLDGFSTEKMVAYLGTGD